MRTTWTALLVATLAVGCKGKEDSQPADKVMGSATGAAKPADDMKPEPVARQPTAPTTPAAPEPATPAAPADDGKVRAPVAADLEVYTKDIAGKGPLTATIATSLGTFHCELYGDKSPITVANFVGLATGKKPWTDPTTGAVQKGKPFFDGLTFHRVIPGFMIQGGDPLGAGSGGPGYQFVNEADQSLTWKPATLAMANAGADTNGSQFFITDDMQDGQKRALGQNYSIFGVCKEVDLVRKIEGVPRNRRDKPDEPVTITKVTVARG